MAVAIPGPFVNVGRAFGHVDVGPLVRAETASVPAVLAIAFVLGVATLGFAVGAVYAGGAVLALAIAMLPLLFLRSGSGARPAGPVAEVGEMPRLFSGRNLITLVVVAAVVRVSIAVIVNSTSLWPQFAPDAVYYQLSGQALVDSWSGPFSEVERWLGSSENKPFYSYLNALSLVVFDTARYPLSIFNSLVGIVVAFLFARLATKLYGPRVGDYVLLLGLFFPSIVVWSCMNIREVWSYLLIALVLLAAHRAKSEQYNPLNLVLLLVAISAMYFVRPYLVPLLMAGVGLSFLVVRLHQLPYAVLAMFAIGLFIQMFGSSIGMGASLLSAESLETVHEMRVNLAFGGSAYGADVDTRTVTGSIAYLPLGILRFLFAPFPWTISSMRQLLTLPESLLWYYLAYRGVRGIWHDVRTNVSKIAAPLLVLLVSVAAYGLVSGNEGTAYRHRAQLMPIVFVFAAADIVRRRRQKASETEA